MLPVLRHRAGLYCYAPFLFTLTCLSTGCRALADGVSPRTIVPAPIVVPASNNWEGNDGPWSTFTIQVGTPAQSVNVFVSTASYQTWVIDPEGCTSTDPSDCSTQRGRFFNYSSSTSWLPNTANITTTIYPLELESGLGYTGNGRYGFDTITLGLPGTGGPPLENQTVASIATKEFYMGVFGLKPQASNFTTLTDPIPSFLQNLKNQSLIPSNSWGYTAGNQYRFNNVFGTLTLGGFDSSKFLPNNLTFGFGPEDNRELIVQLNKITTGDGDSLLPSSIPMLIDSTVPYIYLPIEACAEFETAFGLTWDNSTQLYLLSDAQHAALQTQNPNITFTLGNLTSSTNIEITLPYAAFDLTVSYPIVANATRYFPLKRANDSSQYTLGRTFFQEAYVIADYERRNFSVSQCKWDATASQNIVAILQPSSSLPGNSTNPASASTHLPPIAPIAGAAGGGVLIIVSLLVLLFILRRKKRAKAANSNPPDDAILKPELDGDCVDHKPALSQNVHEVDANQEGKFLPGQQAVEIDPYGQKWPPAPHAVEIGHSGRTSPIYEMAADEVAVEMPSGATHVNRLVSFTNGDDRGPISPSGLRSAGSRRSFLRGYYGERGSDTSPVTPLSRTLSPASETVSPRWESSWEANLC